MRGLAYPLLDKNHRQNQVSQVLVSVQRGRWLTRALLLPLPNCRLKAFLKPIRELLMQGYKLTWNLETDTCPQGGREIEHLLPQGGPCWMSYKLEKKESKGKTVLTC